VKILGYEITIGRAKAMPTLQGVDSRGGWYPVIRESFTGAWQQNEEISVTNVMGFSAVYACVTVPAQDIGKLRIKLMQQNESGIWVEAESPSFSPVLRKPNHFQTRIQFIEHWVMSRRMHGNTYVLKHRDKRGVVEAMYVLDPSRVRPLVAPNGEVFYELKTDHLAGLPKTESVFVPAREIVHDVINALYHPLVGISPISACGRSALQGLRIQENSSAFFLNGSNPGGVLTAPLHISDDTAARVKAYWESEFAGENAGKVAVLGDGLKFEQMSMSAVDAQLIDQLKWTAHDVCVAFHVSPAKIFVDSQPTYNNVEALNQQYYSETLQSQIESIELLLDEGLGLTEGTQKYGVELDLDGLLRMDTAARIKAAQEAISAGLTVNEVRRKFHDLGPVTGGDAVYLQQQNFSLEALAKRDASPDPFGTQQPKQIAAPKDEPKPEPEDEKTLMAYAVKSLRESLAA